MKTALFIFAIILACSLQHCKNQKSYAELTLHPSVTGVSAELLDQTADILNERLKICGFKPTAKVSHDAALIKVTVDDSSSLSEIRALMTSKGDLGIYETGSGNEYENTSASQAGKVGLISPGLNNNAVLTKADIESVQIKEDNSTHFNTIEIKFNPAASGIWAECTRRNLGKPIAIIVDEKVYSAPVVKTIITGGNCELTGSITRQEAVLFRALAGTGTLPVALLPE